MHELKDFEPIPRETSMLDIIDSAYKKGLENTEDFTLTTREDPLGLIYEDLEYSVVYGGTNKVNIRATRPSVDTSDFLRLAEGTIDEKPRAEAFIHAPRSFLFKLANGEKYYADKGYFRVVVLSDGSYLDILSIAFASQTDDFGDTRTIPDTVGSMLRPLPVETDWIIQDIIKPTK